MSEYLVRELDAPFASFECEASAPEGAVHQSGFSDKVAVFKLEYAGTFEVEFAPTVRRLDSPDARITVPEPGRGAAESECNVACSDCSCGP